MEAALHQLALLNQQVGAPRPHQQRIFLQHCIQLLELTREHRLESEHFPSCQQFINDCCADASALLELMECWSCDWRVTFGAVHLAAAGLYAHPDLGHVKVAGVPVKHMVKDILDFISERGIAFGQLEAAEGGVYEDWGQCEHPRTALLRACPDINQLSRAILEVYLEEPQCVHVALAGRNVHYIDV
jgi:hypothetical protein